MYKSQKLHNTTALISNPGARGRVLLANVFRHYESGNNGQVMCDISHLQTPVLKGDNPKGFHNTWTMVVSELSTPPDPALLQLL